MQLRKIEKVKYLMIVPLLVAISACTKVYRPCTDITPTVSQASKEIDADSLVSLSRYIVEGSIPPIFITMAENILSDSALRAWVTAEVSCQVARLSHSDSSKSELSTWMSKTNEIANSDPVSLAAWLKESPTICSPSNTVSKGSISGEDRIAAPGKCYTIQRLGLNGELTVSGRIPVVIDQCNGDIYHEKYHNITVINSGLNCDWYQK